MYCEWYIYAWQSRGSLDLFTVWETVCENSDVMPNRWRRKQGWDGSYQSSGANGTVTYSVAVSIDGIIICGLLEKRTARFDVVRIGEILHCKSYELSIVIAIANKDRYFPPNPNQNCLLLFAIYLRRIAFTLIVKLTSNRNIIIFIFHHSRNSLRDRRPSIVWRQAGRLLGFSAAKWLA